MTTENPDPLPEDPEEIFAGFLQRLDEGEHVDFEEIIAAHPGPADELNRFYAEWNRWASVLEGAAPGPQSIEGVPPEAGGEEDAQPRISSEILRQFAIGSDGKHRYRFRSHVSSGGQGSILKVWDTELRRQLAMKLMLGEKATGEGETQVQYERKLGRFLDEAQITGQLDHPGVIPVHELGVSSSGRAFFTMRLVRGRHFGEVIDELHGGEEGQMLVRCVGILQRICETMAFAHSRGIVHRDLKPENVMVGPFGEVYVMDWGLARVLGKQDQRDLRIVGEERDLGAIDTVKRDARAEDPESPLFTADGAAVGTPMYMSPEQARGELELVGPRSDVYAVGAMIYHLLAGHAPYLEPGTDPNAYTIWRRVMEGPPRAIATVVPDAAEELVAICEKAMARDVDDRYESMKDLLEDLRAYAEGRVVQAHRTGALVELRKWVARNRSTAAALAAAFFLAVAAPITVAVVVNAKNDMISHQQAELHMRVAELAAQRGDGRAVLESLEAAKLAGYDDPIEIAWKRADAYIALNRHEQARPILEALCAEPEEHLSDHAGAIYLRRGHLLFHTWDESSEGVRWIRRALEAKPGPADAELAESYDSRTLREAMEHCRAAVEAAPYHYLANSHLLALLIIAGDEDGATRQASAIGTLFPEDPTPAIYHAMQSAIHEEFDAKSLDDPDLVDRIGKGNVELLQGIGSVFKVLGPILRGEASDPFSQLAAFRSLKQFVDYFADETRDSHRDFVLIGTPAMPLLKRSFTPAFAVLLHMIFLKNEHMEAALCGMLGLEDGNLIGQLFGEELDLVAHADWEACLREAAEINGDGFLWLTLGNLIMLRPFKKGGVEASFALVTEAEKAYRRAYESRSILPSISQVAGPMMIRCQGMLGTAQEGFADPELFESAVRNLEVMVYMEDLGSYRNYLDDSARQLRRHDLRVSLWRQALREHPRSRALQQNLAQAALDAGHWTEAIQVSDGILREKPSDEKALGIRGKALLRAGEWLAAQERPSGADASDND